MSRPLVRTLALLTALTPAALAQDAVASYEVTFDATWSPSSHPGSFPGGAHFSPLVGGTHNSSVAFWAPGGLATNGIEVMAETGSPSPLSGEVSAAIGAGTAGMGISGGGPDSPGTATTAFTVTDEHSLVTLVTMIAPSPDWFVGVHGLELRDGAGWVDEVVVDLFAYDAGTDSGANFNSPNANTNPQDPIALLTGGPFFGTTPLGTFTFKRSSSAAVYGCGTNPAGSLRVLTGLPTLGDTITLGIDDPLGTLSSPAATFLFVSADPSPSFPCGVQVPGAGLGAPGAAGELLLSSILVTLTGSQLVSGPAPIGVTIPNTPGLVGQDFYAQGLVVDGLLEYGLTDAVQLVVGE